MPIKKRQQVGNRHNDLPLLPLGLNCEVAIQLTHHGHPEVVPVQLEVSDQAMVGLNAARRHVPPLSKERDNERPRNAVHSRLATLQPCILPNESRLSGGPAADPPGTLLPAYTRSVRRASRGRARPLQALVRRTAP